MVVEEEFRQECRNDSSSGGLIENPQQPEDRGILNNRRIEYPRQAEDRYCVSSIEYRVSTSSTRDPCNRIDSRKATSLHEGAIEAQEAQHGVEESTTTRVRAVESAISRGRGFDYESGEKSKRIDAVESAVSNNE